MSLTLLNPLLLRIFGFIRALGLWTSACLALSILILLITYLRIGTLVNSKDPGLISKAANQQTLIERMVKNALTIEIAMRQEQWDTIPPALSQFSQDRTLWVDTHKSLLSHRANTFQSPNSKVSIQELYDRVQYAVSHLTQATNEIELISQSITRRAPFIDLSTRNRLQAATHAFTAQEPVYYSTMDSIVQLYEQHAQQQSKHAIISIRRALWFLMATLTATFFIGIAPRYWSLVAKNNLLQNKIIDAQKAANARWAFLAQLGHQFTSPMSTVMGFASILANEEADQATTEEYASSIVVAGRSMTNLVEEIIDMSAIHNNTLKVNPAPTNPRHILGDLRMQFGYKAQRKNLQFTTFFDDSCPVSITSDANRINQLLSKILSNAINFTNTGSVELHAALEKENDKEMLVFKIIDTGIGIDPNKIELAFKPFTTLNTNTQSQNHGAGLGLTIARELAKKLGGDITIDSAPGTGTIVTITINPGQYLAQNDDTQIQPITQKAIVDLSILESKLVLIVDDDEGSRNLLSHTLTKAGCTVQFADNGQIAIDRINRAIQTNNPFDLILMDVNMPVMNGPEATATLRESDITTPIIAVTAHDSPDTHDMSLNAGCDDYLVKPIKKQQLLSTCARWISWNAMLIEAQSDSAHQTTKAA